MSSGGQGISLSQLPLEQLNGLKEQFDNDLRALGAAYDALHAGRTRYLDNVDSLEAYESLVDESVAATADGAASSGDILVCMTASLFVRGNVVPSKKVLIDVGTGYYLEESTEQARKYFTARAGQVKENMDALENNIVTKQQQQNQVIDTIQHKSSAMQKYQQERGAQ